MKAVRFAKITDNFMSFVLNSYARNIFMTKKSEAILTQMKCLKTTEQHRLYSHNNHNNEWLF